MDTSIQTSYKNSLKLYEFFPSLQDICYLYFFNKQIPEESKNILPNDILVKLEQQKKIFFELSEKFIDKDRCNCILLYDNYHIFPNFLKETFDIFLEKKQIEIHHFPENLYFHNIKIQCKCCEDYFFNEGMSEEIWFNSEKCSRHNAYCVMSGYGSFYDDIHFTIVNYKKYQSIANKNSDFYKNQNFVCDSCLKSLYDEGVFQVDSEYFDYLQKIPKLYKMRFEKD